MQVKYISKEEMKKEIEKCPLLRTIEIDYKGSRINIHLCRHGK